MSEDNRNIEELLAIPTPADVDEYFTDERVEDALNITQDDIEDYQKS